MKCCFPSAADDNRAGRPRPVVSFAVLALRFVLVFCREAFIGSSFLNEGSHAFGLNAGLISVPAWRVVHVAHNDLELVVDGLGWVLEGVSVE